MVKEKEIQSQHLSNELATRIAAPGTTTTASTTETNIISEPIYNYYFDKPFKGNGVLEIIVYGNLSNNSGSDINLTLKIYIDNTVVLTTNSVTINSNYQTGAFIAKILIINIENTAAFAVLDFMSSRDLSPNNGGLDSSNTDTSVMGVLTGGGILELDRNRTFKLTTTWSRNDSNASISLLGYIIKKV